MPELMKALVANGRVWVTQNIEEAIGYTDVSFVCVGTPSAANEQHTG